MFTIMLLVFAFWGILLFVSVLCGLDYAISRLFIPWLILGLILILFLNYKGKGGN